MPFVISIFIELIPHTEGDANYYDYIPRMNEETDKFWQEK